MFKVSVISIWLALWLVCPDAKAQLVVADGISPNILVKNVLSGDAGIEIRNIVYKGYDRSLSLFENGLSAGLGIDKGIILSSGLAVGAKGPNSTGTYTSGAGGAGSALLNKYSGNTTVDAAELQFEFRPQTSQVVFNYIFSSEEYIEWVNKGFSDIFGFFVEGPGITGEQNVALVPNTNLSVSIDNINHLKNPEFFRQNNVPGSVSYKFLQHDGQTTKLEAKLSLIPCEWYTIKLSIADVGDNNWDSWVFIEAQSFKHETAVGKDTFYCEENFNKTLNAGYPGKRVIWSTSDTTQSITVNKYGTYWVEIFTDCGSFRDYITINPAIKPFTLGRDTAYCGSLPPLTLGVKNQFFERYVWNTGDTTPEITPKSAGRYTLQVWRYGCTESAEIILGVNPYPQITLPKDTMLCQGNSMDISAGSSVYRYQWSTGETTNRVTLDKAGKWFVKAEHNGCVASDTISVTVRAPFNLDIGPKQLVKCSRDITVLDTRIRDRDGYEFKWNTGERDPYILTEFGGTYWVEVKDVLCNYTASDSIKIIQYEGGAQYFMPNAFSPNNDDFNNTFGPVHELHSLKSYKMLIYNRWGELVFKTETPGERWDGNFNGAPAVPGVYMYICEILSTCLPDKEQFKRGAFNLLR